MSLDDFLTPIFPSKTPVDISESDKAFSPERPYRSVDLVGLDKGDLFFLEFQFTKSASTGATTIWFPVHGFKNQNVLPPINANFGTMIQNAYLGDEFDSGRYVEFFLEALRVIIQGGGASTQTYAMFSSWASSVDVKNYYNGVLNSWTSNGYAKALLNQFWGNSTAAVGAGVVIDLTNFPPTTFGGTYANQFIAEEYKKTLWTIRFDSKTRGISRAPWLAIAFGATGVGETPNVLVDLILKAKRF